MIQITFYMTHLLVLLIDAHFVVEMYIFTISGSDSTVVNNGFKCGELFTKYTGKVICGRNMCAR